LVSCGHGGDGGGAIWEPAGSSKYEVRNETELDLQVEVKLTYSAGSGRVDPWQIRAGAAAVVASDAAFGYNPGPEDTMDRLRTLVVEAEDAIEVYRQDPIDRSFWVGVVPAGGAT
jgi:hypothetical protein